MYHYIYEIQPLMPGWENTYYIGKHSTDEDPFNNSYAGSGTILTNYYSKYGKIKDVTYRKVIIEFNDSSKDNALREADIIGDCYNTDKRCLNLKPGGYGGMTPEIAIKISESCKGRNPWNKHKTGVYNAETTERLKNIAINREFTSETRKRMSESHINKGTKSIIMLDLEGNIIKTYPSIKNAVLDGYCKSSILRVLNGKYKQHKGKIFKYNN